MNAKVKVSRRRSFRNQMKMNNTERKISAQEPKKNETETGKTIANILASEIIKETK